jgi:hypothetical protein
VWAPYSPVDIILYDGMWRVNGGILLVTPALNSGVNGWPVPFCHCMRVIPGFGAPKGFYYYWILRKVCALKYKKKKKKRIFVRTTKSKGRTCEMRSFQDSVVGYWGRLCRGGVAGLIFPDVSKKLVYFRKVGKHPAIQRHIPEDLTATSRCSVLVQTVKQVALPRFDSCSSQIKADR